MTPQDRIILKALDRLSVGSASEVAMAANINTMSRRETAARHLIKLTGLGLAEKGGTRMFPKWRITNAGKTALKES